MPSTSAKQKRFMAAAAHDPEFAAKADIPQSVAQEYFDADQMKKRAPAVKRRSAITKAIAKVRSGA